MMMTTLRTRLRRRSTADGNDNGTYPLIDDGVFNIGAAGDWASGSNAAKQRLACIKMEWT